jgi:hypothetical protein
MTSEEMTNLAKRIKRSLSVSLAEQHEKPGPVWFMPLSDGEHAAIVDALNAAASLRALAELPPKAVEPRRRPRS